MINNNNKILFIFDGGNDGQFDTHTYASIGKWMGAHENGLTASRAYAYMYTQIKQTKHTMRLTSIILRTITTSRIILWPAIIDDCHCLRHCAQPVSTSMAPPTKFNYWSSWLIRLISTQQPTQIRICHKEKKSRSISNRWRITTTILCAPFSQL